MITSLPSLRTWFLDNQKPYWTLYQNGANRAIIARNETVEDLNQAWNVLETNVLAQAEGGTANVRVYVTDKPKHNHGLETEARILPLVAQPGQVGIAGVPAGYVDESRVAGMLRDAEEKWELKQKIKELEAERDNQPTDWTETMINGIERIAQTPLGAALVQRFLGGVPQTPAYQPAPAAMNGVPTSPDGDGDEVEYSDRFFENIETTAALLGVDEETLAQKLAALVAANPSAAKSLLA